MKQYFSDSYITINIIFAGIIFLIFIYSGIFSAENDKHFIKSACIEITRKPCKSIGLSRSFSEIVRLDFKSAEKYNPYGLKVFTFFFVQFILRFGVTFLIAKDFFKREKILYVDVVVSILLFLLTFADFLKFWELELM
jgi:hypothetical protein